MQITKKILNLAKITFILYMLLGYLAEMQYARAYIRYQSYKSGAGPF